MKRRSRWSLFLGKLLGINLYIHWTFILLIAWVLIMNFRMGGDWAEGLASVGFVLIIFACVVLHEYGHALTARRFDITTSSIVLLPIGGMSNMERMPEKPGQELLVALMGPMVNVVIAFGLFLYLTASGTMPTVEQMEALNEEEYSLIGSGFFVFNLMIVNILLVVFNLIPAFPMDGGRVLRAILSLFVKRADATLYAARIGQVLAIVFVVAGFYINIWLILIGVFIFFGAGAEANFESVKHILSDYSVRDVQLNKFTLLSPNDTIEKATNVLLEGFEQEFLVGEGDKVEGVLTRNDIIRGLSEMGKEIPVSKVMNTDFNKFESSSELKEAYHQLMKNGTSIGPVYENNKLVGVLELENINEQVMIKQATAG